MSMTEQEQQIALCEWMGWKCISSELKGIKSGIVLVHWIKPDGVPAHPYPVRDDSGVLGLLPDTSSLDVLHEMEKKLTFVQGQEYVKELYGLIGCHPTEPTWHNQHRLCHTNAKHRREALLRTLGLWKE